MTDAWLNKWEERYRQEAYAFGIAPNAYFQQQIDKLVPGAILLAAEGEGRNAVYAAKLDWDVSAFDISQEGQKKALRLAEQNGVTMTYQVGELPDLQYRKGQFDACALIYAHFPAAIRAQYHRLLDSYVRVGGIIILEAFSKNHLAYRLNNTNVGGPTDLANLISMEDIRADFANYGVIELVEEVINLNEGLYHRGQGAVTRFVGRKIRSANHS
ncbi:methyltransferase domain-containing protein [Spirosoma linguale]